MHHNNIRTYGVRKWPLGKGPTFGTNQHKPKIQAAIRWWVAEYFQLFNEWIEKGVFAGIVHRVTEGGTK